MIDETQPNGNTLTWRINQLEVWRGAVDGDHVKLAVAESDIRAHAESAKRIEGKLDSTNSWLRGIAGGLVLALTMLILNLLLGTHAAVPH